eukprot:8542397-Pyramimonas_sp.AAC.1
MSRSYRSTSAVSVDGFHCRNFSLLSDASLTCLRSIPCLIESLGIFPLQMSVVLLALLPTPA